MQPRVQAPVATSTSVGALARAVGELDDAVADGATAPSLHVHSAARASRASPGDTSAHWSGAPTVLIVSAPITATNRNESSAWRIARLRHRRFGSGVVSETWNVIPIVKREIGEVAVVRRLVVVELDPPPIGSL